MTGTYTVGQVIDVDGRPSIIVEVSAFFYDAIPLDTIFWSGASQERALGQGWAIFEVADGTVEIQRYDEAGRFDSDQSARDFVGNSGDPLCRMAIAYIWVHNTRKKGMAPCST